MTGTKPEPRNEEMITEKNAIETAGGEMIQGLDYGIEYACDTPGPETEEGSTLGRWTGEVDPWGKLTIDTFAGPIFLFPREIVFLSEPYEPTPEMPTPEDFVRVLEFAVKYFDHPDVQAMPFALPASNVSRSVHRIIEAARKAGVKS
jgi:hypothetical protein